MLELRSGIFLFLLVLQSIAFGQLKPQKNYFRSPLDIPLVLSGNFGEIRPNHFHTGLDLKTNNREGLNIYAAADGYVSRIKVSAFGYGKIVYITHPNGYVTAYAHLSSFKGEIAKYVKEAQRINETFEIELFPNAEVLPVKKGQVIALSGNTGGSQGPHLHFEVREEKTENAVNPLAFGFDLKDITKPEISMLAVYLFDPITNKYTIKKLPVKGIKGTYAPANNIVISITEKVGFGIDAIDREIPSGNRNGVYSIQLKVDDKQVYLTEIDSLSFAHNRAINCYIDYIEKRTKGCNIQRCFIPENNKLAIYKEVIDKGYLTFSDDSIHELTYVVKDFFGNSSTLKFKVKKTAGLQLPARPDKPSVGIPFKCGQDNRIERDNMMAEFSADAIYESFNFLYFKTAPKPFTLTPVYNLHNDMTPLHKPFTLSIKVDTVKYPMIKEKGVIANISGERGAAETTEFKKGFLRSNLKNLGKYSVMIDTINPVIKPVNIAEGKNMSKAKGISFKISDNLSGIKKFKVYIDKKWVLMEYEPKQALIYHVFEPELASGQHTLELIVIDQKGNTSNFKANFIR